MAVPASYKINEQSCETLLRFLPTLVFAQNEFHQYVFCTDLFAQTFFNKQSGDVIGKSISEIEHQLTPEQIIWLEQIDNEQLNAKEIVSGTFCADGIMRSFFKIQRPIRNEQTGEKYNLTALAEVKDQNSLCKELHAELDFLNALLEHSSEYIYFKDLQSRFIKVGKIFAERHGYNQLDMLGKTDFDLFGPIHASEAFADEQEMIKTKIPIVGKEEKEDWQDGKTTWALTSKMPLHNSKKEIIGTFGISREITDLKKSEEEKNNMLNFEKMVSKVSTLFLRYGFEKFSSALPIALKELSIFVNSKRSYIYYLDERDNIYKKVVDYPLMENETPLQRILDYKNWYGILKESKIVFDFKDNIEGYGNSSELKYFQLNRFSYIIILPLINYTALVGFAVFECDDLSKTWLKKYKSLFKILSEIISNAFSNNEAEKYRLEAEEEMLKLLRAVNQSSNIVIIMNTEGNIEYVNSRFSEITGYHYDEVIGQKVNFFNESLNKQFDVDAILASVSNGSPWEGAYHDTTKNGKMFWEYMKISPIKNMKGEITNLLAIIEDITEKMVNESRKANSQKLESIGQLAAGIAHEINTPMQFIGDNTIFLKNSLTSIGNYISQFHELINHAISSDIKTITDEWDNLKELYDIEYLLGEIPQSIDQTLTGINRVTNIVSAMKDFAHPSKREKVFGDINHGIEVTATISRNEWKYVADMELKLAKDLPHVYCLQEEMNQVFLIMIVNSAQAIEERIGKNNPTKGKISIETYQENNSAVIKISDTGMGIKESNIAKLFDPFFTTKEVGKGSGQGLTIAHDIVVNKHNGTIFVDSVHGEGTTFTINLPIK